MMMMMMMTMAMMMMMIMIMIIIIVIIIIIIIIVIVIVMIIIIIIIMIFQNFPTSINTDNLTSPAIPVGRGVLQGDCLGSQVFNICFNTFIQFIKQEKYKQLGFSTHDSTDRLFNPIHQFQFADDAAVVTTDERKINSL